MNDFQIYSDSGGSITVKQLGLNLVVGRDDKLIRLLRQFGRSAYPNRPAVEDVSFNSILQMDMFSQIHIIDCSADDPNNYAFAHYGQVSEVQDRKNFEGRRIGDADWRMLREYAAAEYTRTKQDGCIQAAHVLCSLGDRLVSYRKLLIPLSSNGREIDHILMGFVHDDVPVGLRAA
jgi:hypothetical protein